MTTLLKTLMLFVLTAKTKMKTILIIIACLLSSSVMAQSNPPAKKKEIPCNINNYYEIMISAKDNTPAAYKKKGDKLVITDSMATIDALMATVKFYMRQDSIRYSHNYK